jgi:hypothetical protein
MIPVSSVFAQSVMTAMLDHDPVVAQYRAFFSWLDCSLVEDFEARGSGPGRPGHPESAYLKAFLIRQNEGFIYTSQLRRFLLKHPLLVIDLGFHLVLDPSAPYGFDVDKTLPCRYWLTKKLQRLDQELLQALLQATVVALQQEIPGPFRCRFLKRNKKKDVIFCYDTKKNVKAYRRKEKHVLSANSMAVDERGVKTFSQPELATSQGVGLLQLGNCAGQYLWLDSSG